MTATGYLTGQLLLAMPGIGPWTADYLRMRVLGDPDTFLASDLGVRRGLERLGAAGDPRSAADRAEAWRPWRSYALMHLWAASGDTAAAVRRDPPDPTDRSRVTEPDLRPAKEN